MPASPDTPPGPKPVPPRARWIAAQRLAAGATPERAAVQAGIELAALEGLLREGAFQRLQAEEVRQLGLADEEWLKAVRVEVRQAAERALADGRVSTLNWFLRASLDLPALTGRPARASAQAAVAARAYDADDDPPEDAADPDAWLARVPVVEADPAREALRRRLLGTVAHKGMRAMISKAPLEGIEQYVANSDPDPTVHEQWLARQPKPEFRPFLPGELEGVDRALIEHVTRDNPPWIRGEYLGYYRKPVPAHLFGPQPERDPQPAPAASAAPPAPAPIPALRARIARLLDRSAPRLAEELDLAEAICAVKWPKWPEYRGPLELPLVRLALLGTVLEPRTLHWLGGREIERDCKAAMVEQAQGP